MTKIFALANDQKGLSIADIFGELDTDGDGEIAVEELEAGLKALGTFNEVSREDCQGVISYFDKDGDGKISSGEFVEFFSGRLKAVSLERNRKRNAQLAGRFRSVLQAANKKGLKTEDVFAHLDQDKGGSISTKELSEGIRKLPHFKSLSDEDIAGLIEMLDADHNGEISMEEFIDFVSVGSEAEIVRKTERLRSVFQNAQKKNLTIDKIFAHLDKDHSGEVSVKEMAAALKSLPNFKGLTDKDIEVLVSILDADNSGQISLAEFTAFVNNTPVAVVSDKIDEQVDGNNSPNVEDILRKQIHAIAEIDGGVAALLARLDRNEEGLISQSTFMNLLNREGVFDKLSKIDVEKILARHERGRDGQLSVVSLLRFVENREDYALPNPKSLNEDPFVVENDYVFSNDLEVRSLEKKLRSQGRKLAEKGVDVESCFQQFDTRNTGMIRKHEFIEVLSKIGLYILEQGKVLEEANEGNEMDKIRQRQLAQLNRLRNHGEGGGNGYLVNASRAARKLVMNSGDANSDFTVMIVVPYFLLHLTSC